MSDGAIGWRAINFASVLVYLFLFAPIMVTMLLSFNASQFGGFPMTGFSFHWFGVLMNNEIVLAAVRRSLILGSLTATISTVLGIFAATALVRYEFPGKEFVNTLMVAPVLIPETVLAVGLLLFIRWLHAPRTFIVLLMGHVMLSLPYVVLVVQARLLSIKRVYEEAALSLGANRIQTFFEITFPLLMPAVLAGILLAFTISFDNVTATLFWRPPGVETLPTQIYAMLRNSISPEISALGTFMIVITVGLPLIGGGLARYMARKQR